MDLKIAATGFVEAQAGSVASANVIILKGLLEQGVEVHFFSKPSFVDPRPVLSCYPNFKFHDVTNLWQDRLRRRLSRVPVLRQLSERFDAASYDKLLVQRISETHRVENFDLCLWLGTYAPAQTPGLPAVSFAQGPPGTDARSFIERKKEIALLAGQYTARKWEFLARLRLSRFGLPNFSASDHIIVGSQQSVRTLQNRYRISAEKVSASPYPVDLTEFHLPDSGTVTEDPEWTQRLRVLWLGRIVPRKRLDVFLEGAIIAIQRGVPLEITIAGQPSLVDQYEKLIADFPFPERLTWHRHLPREEVPGLLWRHDVLAQPSDEENFGSSILEAQACGLPVIVGHTNGNADYMCERSIHLEDDRYETFASALEQLFLRKKRGEWGDARTSRLIAEEYSAPQTVVQRLLKVFESLKSDKSASAS